MHFLLLALLAPVLISCGGGLGVDVVGAVKYTVFGSPDLPISRDLVDEIPYATIAAKIGKGPRSLLVLWRTEGDALHWLSADGVAIVTRGGRVIRTAGLPTTIRDTIILGADPVATGLQLDPEQTLFTREVDFPSTGIVVMSSNFKVVGPKSINIVEIDFETILVEEQVLAGHLNWKFTNHYWVDPADGFVWRSRQTISRDFPPIVIEALKPAQRTKN
jgi:hypothetical protein